MIRRMTKISPRGEQEVAKWDTAHLGLARVRELGELFNQLVREGYIPAATLEKSDKLIRWFNPELDIVMIPGVSGGALQTFQELLVSQREAGTTFATYTAAKTVIPATNLITIPSNWFYVGRAIHVMVTGAVSNIVTTPGLMNFQLKVGSVAAFDTGNIQLNATAHTTLPFWLEILVTCRAIGVTTAANLMGVASITGKMFTATAGQTDSAQDMPSLIAPATAPVVGTGFDSTIANIIDLWVGFTISNAANLIRIDQYVLHSLN